MRINATNYNNSQNYAFKRKLKMWSVGGGLYWGHMAVMMIRRSASMENG